MTQLKGCLTIILSKTSAARRASVMQCLKLCMGSARIFRYMMSLHLVVSLRREDGVRYKACYADNRCVQVCTICGKAKDVKAAEVVDAFVNLRLKRFRKEGFSMYIYGICSTCQARLTRQKKKESSSKQE